MRVYAKNKRRSFGLSPNTTPKLDVPTMEKQYFEFVAFVLKAAFL